jgi:acetylornithine deacetylase
MTDVVALAAELLSIQSPTGHEGRVVDFVSRWLVARGWNVTIQEVTPGRSNVWASRAGGGVTLSTHLDTVPPYVAPRLVGDRLLGRGACDAKGIAAAMMVAADHLAAAGESRVDLLLLVGEERGSDGARAANQLAATSRFLINGEPTENKLALGSKGALRFEVVARGKMAHSAYPHLGESAIEKLLDVLERVRKLELPRDPLFGHSTVNIGTIQGGRAPNVIPDFAKAEIFFRLVEDGASTRAAMQAISEKTELSEILFIPAMRFGHLDGFETSVVSYATDIPAFGGVWGEPFLFGPGSIHVAHTAEERVPKREVLEAVEIYQRMTKELLGK